MNQEHTEKAKFLQDYWQEVVNAKKKVSNDDTNSGL